MPSSQPKTTGGRALVASVLLFALLVVTLNGIDAAVVPLAFQSPIDTPTPSATPTFDPLLDATPTPTFDPDLLPTATPTFDPNLLPTVTPTFDPNLYVTPAPTIDPSLPPVEFPLPPDGITDSLSSVLEAPPLGAPSASDALPLLPKPNLGEASAAAPEPADPAREARVFGRTVMAALTYVWMGCGIMLLLLAGVTLLWLSRRSRLR